MARDRQITLRLTHDEYEWLRRKAHWDGDTMAAVLRLRVHGMIREEGYLRPPDDEPQDFGDEKEMIEFVNAVAHGEHAL